MDYPKGMQRKNQALIALAAGLILASASVNAVPAAQLKENYQSIIERNPFGLKPPPPPPTNNTAAAEQKPKLEVFLTGVTSIGYPKFPKQAYFYTREQGKKDVTYYALTEGAGKDGIQVLNIDPEKRKVKIKMDNAETLLSFETHGVPIQAAAVGRPFPGVPGATPFPMPNQGQPGVQPLPVPGAAPHPGATYDANGQPVYNSGGTVPQPLNPVMNQGNTGLRQIPSRRIRGGNSYNSGGPVPGGAGGIGEGGMGQPQAVATDPAEEYVKAHLNNAARRRETPNIPVPPLPTIE